MLSVVFFPGNKISKYQEAALHCQKLHRDKLQRTSGHAAVASPSRSLESAFPGVNSPLRRSPAGCTCARRRSCPPAAAEPRLPPTPPSSRSALPWPCSRGPGLGRACARVGEGGPKLEEVGQALAICSPLALPL